MCPAEKKYAICVPTHSFIFEESSLVTLRWLSTNNHVVHMAQNWVISAQIVTTSLSLDAHKTYIFPVPH